MPLQAAGPDVTPVRLRRWRTPSPEFSTVRFAAPAPSPEQLEPLMDDISHASKRRRTRKKAKGGSSLTSRNPGLSSRADTAAAAHTGSSKQPTVTKALGSHSTSSPLPTANDLDAAQLDFLAFPSRLPAGEGVEGEGEERPEQEGHTPRGLGVGSGFLIEEKLDAVDEYWEAVRLGEASCIRLNEQIYAIEHFAKGIVCAGAFYHVRIFLSFEEALFTCDCPNGLHKATCLHIDVVRKYRKELDKRTCIADERDPPVVQLRQDYAGARSWLSVLSARDARSEDGKRTIVALHARRWSCQKCRAGRTVSSACVHRKQASKYLQGVLKTLGEEEEEEEIEEEDSDELAALESLGDHELLAHQQQRPVSHLPVAPPLFARLPSDSIPPILYPDPKELPELLCLDAGARCRSCARTTDRSQTGRQIRRCFVFTSHGRLERRVEIGFCGCRMRHKYTIGPDLGNLGVFNWNNEYLFSHELFANYLAQSTSSETPLASFAITIERLYLYFGPHSFVSRSTFNRVYFGYLGILELPTSFACNQCGSTPDAVIPDGVNLSYSARLRSEHLRPPTVPGEHSSKRENVTYPRTPQLIPNAARRKALSKVVQSITPKEDQETGTTIRDVRSAVELLAQFEEDTKTARSAEQDGLRALCMLLRLLINPPGANATFLRHLSHLLAQAAAFESVLQLCPPMTIPDMLQVGNQSAAVDLRAKALQRLENGCPAVYRACRAFHQIGRPVPGELLAFADGLGKRASAVLAELPTHSIDSPNALLFEGEDWRVTGSCYGAPKIRSRPVYPRLRGDPTHLATANQQPKDKQDDTLCSKYYDRYGKPRQTGGVMAVWCKHRICVGFHCIPHAEGRNDVFAALYCHWPTAPKLIVYDFCCAAAPYCLAREPTFFANTRFVIDEMHAHDHTRCSRACFASNYMAADPMLHSLNTSAAECGNSGVRRIKKTVSYCSERHAILHARTYFALMNRISILQGSKVGSSTSKKPQKEGMISL